jgi:putative salt-induced outer membrane protein YdiY
MLTMPAKMPGMVPSVLLGWALAAAAADSSELPKPATTTNVILVTNVVVVTNYIVVTNTVVTTSQPGTGPASSALPDLSWVPPEDGFDWVQLKSGEWLKGYIKAMQKHVLEFDSEELELLTFDWKDIRQLRSPHINEMLLENKQMLSGPITITPDVVSVGGDTPRTFARGELVSITPGGSREANYWSGKIAMGLTLSSGNSRSLDYNAHVVVQRRTAATRFSFDYLGNINIADDVESANNHRINSEFDYWFSSRLYLIAPQVEYYKDRFQNIDDRVTLGAGVGYDLIYRRGLEWSVSTGPAWQKTWFNSVPAGSATEVGAAALTFGTRFEWELTRRVDFTLEYRGNYTSSDVGETFHHAVATLEVDLTKRFELDLSFIWDRTQNPKPEANGNVPKQDDFRLVVALGVRF